MSYVIFTIAGLLLAILGGLLFLAAAAYPPFEAYYGRQAPPAGVQSLGEEAPPGETLSIPSSSGGTLAGKLFLPVEERPASEAVLLVPDFGGCSRELLPWIRLYTSLGSAVLLPDYRWIGRGGNAWRSRGPLEREDLLDWIRWSASREDFSGVVLHGFGFGSRVCTGLLRSLPLQTAHPGDASDSLRDSTAPVAGVIASFPEEGFPVFSSVLGAVYGKGPVAKGVAAVSGLFFALRFRRFPDPDDRSDPFGVLSGISVPLLLFDQGPPSAEGTEPAESRRVSDFMRRLT